jgi:hypothetical protein
MTFVLQLVSSELRFSNWRFSGLNLFMHAQRLHMPRQRQMVLNSILQCSTPQLRPAQPAALLSRLLKHS